MGIQHPGFQLLSLANPSPSISETFAHTPCVLPDQIAIYTHRYIPLVVLTILYFFIANVLTKFRRPGMDAPSHSRSFSKYLNSLRSEALPEPIIDPVLKSPMLPRSPRPSALNLYPATSSQLTMSPRTPSFRPSSQATGEGSNLVLENNNHDDGYYSGEESMDPAQFANRRPSQAETYGSPQILPLPGLSGRNRNVMLGQREQPQDRSKFFVLRWPRVTDTIRSLQGASSAFLAAGRESGFFVRRRLSGRTGLRGLLTLVLLDAIAVAWCPIAIYLFIVYWMYR